MQTQFNSVSELGQPGPKFQKLFNFYWPGYNNWLISKGAAYVPDLQTAVAALQKYMPEMVPTYERICKLVNADDVMAKFLTGFQPPAYISACSQAVITNDVIQLVRNYDYHPDLLEGTMLQSSWNGKKVIGTSDCIVGLVDGMNDDGLAVSLTFGGRKQVGKGFGIPFILRYVLEFCSTVDEAVAALIRIPSHMSYNVTVVDKSGTFKTVLLSPDREPVVTDAAYTTNHQGFVDWPENATFNKTIKRSEFLKDLLTQKNLSPKEMSDAFLAKPLYNTLFKEGFGTLFTSVYRPAEGVMELRWPSETLQLSFDNFVEGFKIIEFGELEPATILEPYMQDAVIAGKQKTAAEAYIPKANATWQETVAESLVNAMVYSDNPEDREKLNAIRKQLFQKGDISWEILADHWSSIGKNYWNS